MSGAPLELRIESRVDRVDAATWNDLAAGRSFASHRWLRLTEAVATTFEPRYVLATRGTRLVAAAVCSVDRLANPAGYQRSALTRGVARLLRPLLPTLSVALPLAFTPGILLRDEQQARAEGWRAILGGIEQVAAAERAPSVRVAHLGDADPGPQLLAGTGFRSEAELPNVRLDVRWPSRDAYEAWLPHKKRSELRRVRHRAAERGLVVEAADARADDDPALRRMIGSVIRKHAAYDPWSDDLLPRARELLAGDMTVLVARAAGLAAGCLVLLRSRDEMVLKWPGLDHAAARRVFAYRCLLAASVEHAIAAGVRRLWLGPTAYDLKRDLGAVSEPRSALVRERGRVLHWLARQAGAAARGATP